MSLCMHPTDISIPGKLRDQHCPNRLTKNLIWSLDANRPAPMLCTGASPHRSYCRATRRPPSALLLIKAVRSGRGAHVEPSFALEVVKVVRVGLAPPKVEVANLEVRPDCRARVLISSCEREPEDRSGRMYSDSGCTPCLRLRRGSPSSCPGRRAPGGVS